MSKDASGDRAKVRLSVGDIVVEVECGVAEVGGVVDEVLKVLGERGATGGAETASGGMAGEVAGGRGQTCKGVITRLWREGWFGVQRSLGEVHGEMGRRGFHYDRTAVAHALVDLVREGILTRVGRPRRYRYVQKRPPPTVRPEGVQKVQVEAKSHEGEKGDNEGQANAHG
jgi:hypothetical protein